MHGRGLLLRNVTRDFGTLRICRARWYADGDKESSGSGRVGNWVFTSSLGSRVVISSWYFFACTVNGASATSRAFLFSMFSGAPSKASAGLLMGVTNMYATVSVSA